MKRNRKQRLVGFARAISDMGLVATLVQVVVDPELQDLGIGTLMTQQLTCKISTTGPYEVTSCQPRLNREAGSGGETPPALARVITGPHTHRDAVCRSTT